MGLKLLLIEPSGRFPRVFGKISMMRLTMCYIAGYIPDDIPVEVCDENERAIDFNTDADYVLISILTASSRRGYEIADEFRKRGKKVVIGGVHATALPEEAIEHADAVVKGECENIMDELIGDMRNDSMKKFYSSKERFPLEKYRIPNRRLLNIKAYATSGSVIETSRGCPFGCEFCYSTEMYGAKIRFRTVASVIEEIKDVVKEGGYVTFSDDNITINKERAKELFRALIPLKIRWIGMGTINCVQDAELLMLMKDSGCVLFGVGFESIEPRNIQESTGKNVVNLVQEYENAVAAFHKAGIGVLGFFMVGMDHDTPSTIFATYDFIMRSNIDVCQITILTPAPGSALWDRLNREKRIINYDWTQYDGLHLLFKTKSMTNEEFIKECKRFGRRLYSYRSILLRALRSRRYIGHFSIIFYFIIGNCLYKSRFNRFCRDH